MFHVIQVPEVPQLSLAWPIIIISSAPLSRAHRSTSPAAQRSTVQCRAGPCPAVPCPWPAAPCGIAVRCCAILYRAGCFLLYFSYMPSNIRSVILIPPVLLLYVPGTIILNHKKNALTAPAQPSYSAALQHRAVPYLRNCPAFP